MDVCSVNVVTAFGRGETLSRDLDRLGFRVRILDATTALRGPNTLDDGPFPAALGQTDWPGARPLPRGLVLWTKAGPLEFGGPMAGFLAQKPEVRALDSGRVDPDFARDWPRRFVRAWASPEYVESWAVAAADPAFPHDAALHVTAPSGGEYKQYRFNCPGGRVGCAGFLSWRANGSHVTEMIAEVGRAPTVFAGDRWVWCLSGKETRALGPGFAAEFFPRGVAESEWEWLAFGVGLAHGPWVEGLPDFVVAIGDVFLPYAYANVVVLRRGAGDRFRAWVKVPVRVAESGAARAQIALETESTLRARFALARWTVDADEWGLCPDTPIFRAGGRFKLDPGWQNVDWIAPETLPRLDAGARLRLEDACVRRVVAWREERRKKRGTLPEGASA